jgi:hypothetical protein
MKAPCHPKSRENVPPRSVPENVQHSEAFPGRWRTPRFDHRCVLPEMTFAPPITAIEFSML